MENNNDNRVAKVDLRAAGGAESVTDDTVHKVNLGAPAEVIKMNEQNDDQNQSNDEEDTQDTKATIRMMITAVSLLAMIMGMIMTVVLLTI